jgi:sigma-B regulation protein RsbU (phosphoserine phosphatase)
MPAECGLYPRRRFHARVRAVALAVTLLLVLFEALLGRRLPQQPYSGIVLNDLSVARVARGSPSDAAGLVKGDRVIALDGAACSSLKDVSNLTSTARPGDTITYEVARGARILALPVTLSLPPFSEVLRKSMLILVGLSFVTIGLVVYFRRSDKLALVFFLLCLAFGLVLVNIVNFEISSATHAYKAVLYDVMVLALPALFLHFFLLFPERSPILVRRPGLEYLIYLPAAVFVAATGYFNVMIFGHGRAYPGPTAVLQNATAVYFASFVVLGLAAFLRSYRRTKAPALRRRLRLVVWGTIAGIAPILFVRIVVSIEPSVELPGERLVFLPLLLVPTAFGHAIVRYGLMDLEIVLKRSLVYTVLTAVLAAVYFAVVYGIGRLASEFVGSADLLFSVISIFCITLLISPLRSKIGASVDRMFFRDEYNYRRVLKQISHSLAGMVDLEHLLGFLATRVGEVLHASAVAIYLEDARTSQYTARCAVGVSAKDLKPFPADGALAACLASSAETLNVERDLALDRPMPIARSEIDGLSPAKPALVVPLVYKSRLLGFMSIGRRIAGRYYAATDVELIETLCDQASVAIENARLYLETVEKQKMEQELEVAREIQRRLLPKSFPEIRGLETHGVNIPSKHVGGDYYDVIPLGASKVAVVIADVSGKGVPAALLMASLQSSLRAEAQGWRRPSEVMATLNETIYEHTSGDTFVTIFYGVIDFERRVLTYSSAGQTPPFIVRKDLGFERLDRTDIVLGIESRADYHDHVVPVGPGDLLFLYTDGITDELDRGDEPFGEDRLLSRLVQGQGLDLETIVQQVYDAVVSHTQGKPQDDLTALAIRIESPAHRPQTGALQKTAKSRL